MFFVFCLFFCAKKKETEEKDTMMMAPRFLCVITPLVCVCVWLRVFCVFVLALFRHHLPTFALCVRGCVSRVCVFVVSLFTLKQQGVRKS